MAQEEGKITKTDYGFGTEWDAIYYGKERVSNSSKTFPDNICIECFGMGRVEDKSRYNYGCVHYDEYIQMTCPRCNGTGVEPEAVPILVDCDKCGGTGWWSPRLHIQDHCSRCDGTGKLQVGIETIECAPPEAEPEDKLRNTIKGLVPWAHRMEAQISKTKAELLDAMSSVEGIKVELENYWREVHKRDGSVQ